jgi:hypothetical protein
LAGYGQITQLKYQANWLKRQCFWLAFRRCPVETVGHILTILRRFGGGEFPQFFQMDARIIL